MYINLIYTTYMYILSAGISLYIYIYVYTCDTCIPVNMYTHMYIIQQKMHTCTQICPI